MNELRTGTASKLKQISLALAMIATSDYYLILVCEQALWTKRGKEKSRRKRTLSPSANSLLASSLPAAVRAFQPKLVKTLI